VNQYRNQAKSDIGNPLIERNVFNCESTAYRRMKERGLCDEGFVPQFYGIIKEIRPELWKPHLDMFLDHDLSPNAILVEYVPHLQMVDLSTFSRDLLQRLVTILEAIHGAKVLHMDPYPRNMMIVVGTPDRALWLDFDRAQTFSDPLTPQQQVWFDEEMEMMVYFAKALVSDMFPTFKTRADIYLFYRLRITKRTN
jgi:hypothetical protein